MDDKQRSPHINILLLGETGIGKSTLINSFANYARFETLIEAQYSKLQCLVPTKFVVSTADGEPKILESMSANKTIHEVGNFSTEEVNAYDIKYKGLTMRLIDTPGITSTVIKDTANCAKILEFISSLEHLHGVCVMIKPDLSRITPDFMYSLLMYITRLGRSAAANIIFLFTRTRRSNYMALDTITCIKPMLEEIATKQHLVIPLRYKKAERRNCFCFENECFNFLVARAQGVQMSTSRTCLEESWNVSKNSMSALMDYIVGDSEHPPLPMFILQNFEQVVTARALIFEMTIVLIDVVQLMCTNIQLFFYQRSNQNGGKNLNEMKITPNKKLSIQLLKPAVATCVKCRTDCSLANVQEECLSNGLLKHTMLDTCKECFCDSTMHLFRYYRKREVENPASGSIAIPLAKYYAEYLQILAGLGMFAKFLGRQSFKVIEDVYDVYLNTLIATEETARGDNRLQLKRYKQLRQKYRTIRDGHEELGKYIIAGYVMYLVEELKTLSYSGATICQLHALQNARHVTDTPMDVDDNADKTPLISDCKKAPQMPIVTPDVKAEKKNDIIRLISEDNMLEGYDKLREFIAEYCGKQDVEMRESSLHSKLENRENVNSLKHLLQDQFNAAPTNYVACSNETKLINKSEYMTSFHSPAYIEKYKNCNSCEGLDNGSQHVARVKSDKYSEERPILQEHIKEGSNSLTYAQTLTKPSNQPVCSTSATQQIQDKPHGVSNLRRTQHRNYKAPKVSKDKKNEKRTNDPPGFYNCKLD